jgi:hypothetical protein
MMFKKAEKPGVSHHNLLLFHAPGAEPRGKQENVIQLGVELMPKATTIAFNIHSSILLRISV